MARDEDPRMPRNGPIPPYYAKPDSLPGRLTLIGSACAVVVLMVSVWAVSTVIS